ncbi:MAG: ABC transporter substrate-binding protein [Dehalococcoidia bacterium]|nr:ABC transporter substrate-binding protein [Dehalococcoidia bacterium]
MTLQDSLTKIARQSPTAGVAGTLSVAVLLTAAFALFSCANDAPGSTPTPTSAPNGGGQPNGTTEPPGVTDDRILFGQSAAFTGPAAELGQNMRLGIEAAFNEANERGGVHGRRLELTSLDDAYEPEAAIANTAALLEQEQVFALIGAVGTPTSRSALPVATATGSPYIAPFTGAGFLRDSELGNVINLRASYAQETEEMVERLTTDLGIDRIAVMYQDDSYGRAGYSGAVAAVERRGMELAGVGVYTRNTTAVKTGILDLREGSPDAVIVIGAYRPVAALVAWSRYTGWDPIFMTVSFVGSNALVDELGADGAGVYVTQVVPFPTDASVPVVAAYHEALAAYAPDVSPGFVSLEGYLAGRLAAAGLELCGRELDRDCFLKSTFGAGAISLDGFELEYGARDNQGSDAVFLTAISRDGEYVATEKLQGALDE